jgi:aryl-alcohol dehydrogenase-like predicted oxidoreductase
MRPDHQFGEGDWRSGRGTYADWREEGSEWSFDPGPLARDLAKVDEMRVEADRLGVSVPQLALRWVIEQRGMTAAIAGSRNPDHTRANAEAGSLRLDGEASARLDQLFG